MDGGLCDPKSSFSELEAAVRRLTPAAVALRRAHLGSASMLSFDEGCRTPDSIMSTGSSGAFSGNSNSNWKLPDKLQVNVSVVNWHLSLLCECFVICIFMCTSCMCRL